MALLYRAEGRRFRIRKLRINGGEPVTVRNDNVVACGCLPTVRCCITVRSSHKAAGCSTTKSAPPSLKTARRNHRKGFWITCSRRNCNKFSAVSLARWEVARNGPNRWVDKQSLGPVDFRPHMAKADRFPPEKRRHYAAHSLVEGQQTPVRIGRLRWMPTSSCCRD